MGHAYSTHEGQKYVQRFGKEYRRKASTRKIMRKWEDSNKLILKK